MSEERSYHTFRVVILYRVIKRVQRIFQDAASGHSVATWHARLICHNVFVSRGGAMQCARSIHIITALRTEVNRRRHARRFTANVLGSVSVHYDKSFALTGSYTASYVASYGHTLFYLTLLELVSGLREQTQPQTRISKDIAIDQRIFIICLLRQGRPFEGEH